VANDFFIAVVFSISVIVRAMEGNQILFTGNLAPGVPNLTSFNGKNYHCDFFDIVGILATIICKFEKKKSNVIHW
jgi:hypothetical protein